MPANTKPIFPLSIAGSAVTIVNADGTSEKTVATAGANGSRVDSVPMTSDDTSDRVFKVLMNNGSTSYPVGEVTAKAGAGTDGTTKAQNVLNDIDLPWLDASGSLWLKAGWTLKMAAKVAVTAAKTVSVVAIGGDY